MQIENNKVVGVHYALEVDGMQIDASEETPLVYLHGHGMMIPGFERQLEGLKQGEKYSFEVTPEEGYGVYDETAVVDLEKEIFLIDGSMSTQVYEGAQIQMSNQDSRPIQGVVLEIAENHVKMDFNHALAGKTLNFSGHIESLREATPEEIDHGHVH